MRTLIVDNYLPDSPQTEHLYKIICDAAVHTVEVRDYSTIGINEELKQYDAIVLSGSQRKLAEIGVAESYSAELELIRRHTRPILGICFGIQLIGLAYGEDIVNMGQMLDGYYMVKVVEKDELFEALSDKFLVRESHEELVAKIPYDFKLLAESPNCPIETIKHMILPIYGVQFHPERFDDKHPAGKQILENFFRLASFYT
jgi:GMP synthase-like glutamine amidotransferase